MGWFIASAPETGAKAIGKLNFWLAGFSYAEDELNEFRTFLAQDFVTVVEYDGLQRPYAPDFSYYLQARYERPVFDNLGGYLATYGRPNSWAVEVNYSW